MGLTKWRFTPNFAKPWTSGLGSTRLRGDRSRNQLHVRRWSPLFEAFCLFPSRAHGLRARSRWAHLHSRSGGEWDACPSAPREFEGCPRSAAVAGFGAQDAVASQIFYGHDQPSLKLRPGRRSVSLHLQGNPLPARRWRVIRARKIAAVTRFGCDNFAGDTPAATGD